MARQNEDAKQAFFRNMSHDMRTPLNAVLGRVSWRGSIWRNRNGSRAIWIKSTAPASTFWA